MSQELTEIFRYIYGALAIIVSSGFIATLVIRWEHLYRGERILRTGIVLEQLVISYAAYIAIKDNYPTSSVGIMLASSMGVMIVGFIVWFTDNLLEGDHEVRRLTTGKRD